MTHIQQLELTVLQLNKLSLRPTLEQIAKIGEVLVEARPLLAYGMLDCVVKRANLIRVKIIYTGISDRKCGL